MLQAAYSCISWPAAGSPACPWAASASANTSARASRPATSRQSAKQQQQRQEQLQRQCVSSMQALSTTTARCTIAPPSTNILAVSSPCHVSTAPALLLPSPCTLLFPCSLLRPSCTHTHLWFKVAQQAHASTAESCTARRMPMHAVLLTLPHAPIIQQLTLPKPHAPAFLLPTTCMFQGYHPPSEHCPRPVVPAAIFGPLPRTCSTSRPAAMLCHDSAAGPAGDSPSRAIQRDASSAPVSELPRAYCCWSLCSRHPGVC
jgi:hypothetical protein